MTCSPGSTWIGSMGRADQSPADSGGSGADVGLGSAERAGGRAGSGSGWERADQSPTNSGESGADMGLGSAQSCRDGQVPGDSTAGAAAVRPGAIDWLLVAFVTLLSAFAALVGVAYLPWHVGPVPMPISALLGVGAMILAPRAAYRLTGSMLAAVLPVVAWFGTTVWLVLHRNPMMLSQALSVVNGQW